MQLLLFYAMLKTKQLCHSERSEEPGVRETIRFLASLGMTQLYDNQCNLAFVPANAEMRTYPSAATSKYRMTKRSGNTNYLKLSGQQPSSECERTTNN